MGWRVHGILLPGFGPELSRLGDHTRADWVSAASAALERLRSEFGGPALIGGYSMGAAIALHLEIGPADRLVLFAPFWRYPGVLPKLIPLVGLLFPELRPVQNGDFVHPDVRHQLERLLPDLDLDDPQVQAAIEDRLVLPVSAAQEALKLGQEGYRRAAKIDANILVVRGASDPLVNQDLTLKLTRRLSKAKTTYLEVDAGHDLLMEDNPAYPEILTALEKFIEGGDV
jgi:pimeloyl-ACP methyl ester carboxylesterase